MKLYILPIALVVLLASPVTAQVTAIGPFAPVISPGSGSVGDCPTCVSAGVAVANVITLESESVAEDSDDSSCITGFEAAGTITIGPIATVVLVDSQLLGTLIVADINAAGDGAFVSARVLIDGVVVILHGGINQTTVGSQAVNDTKTAKICLTTGNHDVFVELITQATIGNDLGFLDANSSNFRAPGDYVVTFTDDGPCVGPSVCNGDGGNQVGCTNCPCGNNAAAGTIGGCLNSAGTAMRLIGSGIPSVAADTLRFEITGAPAGSFCILTSGNNVAPANMANPCFGLMSGTQSAVFDGLRCAVGATRRHGGRVADPLGQVGVTNNGWGGISGPPAGLIAAGGFASGQCRFYQVINRDTPLLVCMRGLNTSQAIRVTFGP